MKLDRRKVLMISYVWPPMEGVGLIRALKFAKYLPEYGWQPIILTVNPDAGYSTGVEIDHSGKIKIIKTGYRDIIEDVKRFFHIRDEKLAQVAGQVSNSGDGRKKNNIKSFVRELISMPDEQIGWYKFAVEEARRVIDEERVDMIFSTSPPETSHMIARRLKREHNIPWIADFRDLWADDHFRDRPLYKKMYLRHLEKRTLEDADFLITVSDPWARRLGSSMGRSRPKTEVIENGFDEEDFAHLRYEGNEKLTIVYTGKLHREHQPVDIFFKALRDLIREGDINRNKVSVKFYVLGYDRPDIITIAASYGLSDVVSQFDRVSYNRSLEIQRSSDALLFVQWRGEGGDGWYSAKLYDYIGARRPILALAERGGIIEELIAKTSSGVIADDEGSLKKAILKFYAEFVTSGRIRYEGNEDVISKNTRRCRTEQLAELFDSVCRAQPAADEDRWIGEILGRARRFANELQPWNNYYLLRAKEMETFLSLHRMKKVKRILEIGCGNGFVSAILSKSAEEVIATDLSRFDVKAHSIGISKANELFKILNVGNCRAVSSSSDHLPFEDGVFDIVFSAYTLEHISDRAKALREVERVLKSGGEAIFIVPSFMERLLYPFSHYWEIYTKVVDIIFKRKNPETISSHNERYAGREHEKTANGPISTWRAFRGNHPHFPMPDPHGEYPDYFVELIQNTPFAWLNLMKNTNLVLKEAFTIMLFPKAFSSIFLGDRSLEAYIKTLWINKRFGKGRFLKHLGQNLCLILKKDDA